MKPDQDLEIEVRINGHGLIPLYRPLEATSFLVRPNAEQDVSRTELPQFAEKYKGRNDRHDLSDLLHEGNHAGF